MSGLPARRAAASALPFVLAAAILAGCGGGAKPVPGATVSKDRTEIDGISLIGFPRIAQGVCAPPVFEIPTPVGLADPDDGGSPPAPPPVAETPPLPEQSAEPAGSASARRILVVGDSLLDGLCALGLGDRVVGRVAERAGEDAPNYLGPVVAGLPQPGSVGSVAVDQVKDLHPDLVLVRSDLADKLGADLGAIAPVLPVSPVGEAGPTATWQRRFLALGAAFGREAQARAVLDEYRTFVREQRQDDTLDPAHTRASLVRFDDGRIAIEGPESFAGSVLAELGVDRPPAQLSAGAERVIGFGQLHDADGDLIYVSFGQPESFGRNVVASSEWRNLASVRSKQVFAVYDQWWYRGAGPIAALAVVIDVVGTLNAPPPP